jgi:hypothetical protein
MPHMTRSRLGREPYTVQIKAVMIEYSFLLSSILIADEPTTSEPILVVKEAGTVHNPE